MNQYDLSFNNSTQSFDKVVNKVYGHVVFEAQKIDEQATYVMNSRM